MIFQYAFVSTGLTFSRDDHVHNSASGILTGNSLMIFPEYIRLWQSASNCELPAFLRLFQSAKATMFDPSVLGKGP